MHARNSLTVAIAAAVTAAFLSVAIQPAKAGIITWGSAQNITGASDVSTVGTLFASANFTATPTGTGSGNVTVNTVNFNEFRIVGGTSQTVGNITLTGSNLLAANVFGGPSSYNGLLAQSAFDDTNGSIGVTIGGLTTGAGYLVQYWVQDGRLDGLQHRTTVVGGVTLDQNVSNTFGGFGQYVIGTFTATSSTQSFNATKGIGPAAMANAMQVRLTSAAVPEPASGAIAALLMGGTALRQWRKKRRQEANEEVAS